MSRIWDAELAERRIRVLAVDPGDMDTPLHALALPEADRATLGRPEDSALEIVEELESQWKEGEREGRDEAAAAAL
jgi:NAD(P)-dependent dehydrogenase (short-subunit alcohol dehydrogenase family)